MKKSYLFIYLRGMLCKLAYVKHIKYILSQFGYNGKKIPTKLYSSGENSAGALMEIITPHVSTGSIHFHLLHFKKL